jgi:hypothetical protein
MNGNDCLRRVRGVAAGVACVTLLMGAASVRADSAQLETKSYTIPSGDPGIDLFIRNKHQARRAAIWARPYPALRAWCDLSRRDRFRSAGEILNFLNEERPLALK